MDRNTGEVIREAVIQPNTINTDYLYLPMEWQILDRLDDPIDRAYNNPDIWLETQEGQVFQTLIENTAADADRGHQPFTVFGPNPLSQVSYWGINEMNLRLGGREVSEVITNGEVSLNVGPAISDTNAGSVSVPALSNSNVAIHTHPANLDPRSLGYFPSHVDYNALDFDRAGGRLPEYHTIVTPGQGHVIHFWLDENGNAMLSVEQLNFSLPNRLQGE